MRLAVGLLLLVLAAAVAWTGALRLRQANLASMAAENLAECQRLAQAIQKLSRAPARAQHERKADEFVSRAIQAAAEATGITGDSLLSISPVPPRRVEKSSYLEASTELALRRVELGKLVEFLDALESSELGLTCTSLRLSPAASTSATAAADELWTTELVLTYLVFSPQSAPAR